MSRRKENQVGSLELLLDTICNTFGGVLFISMLVVVLLNMTSRRVALEPPTEAAQAELIECQQELAESRHEMTRLQTAVKQQGKIADQILEPDLEDLARQLADRRDTRDRLAQSKDRSLEEISQSQVEVNKIARELKKLDDQMRQARQKLAHIDRRLQEEINSRTRTAKLPTPRTTTKIEVPLFLCGGRLSSYAKRGPDGSLVPNPAECQEKKDANNQPYIEPTSGAGTPVDPKGDAGGAVAARLSAFDKDQHYLAVFVSPNSFGHFATVRNVMVRLQFGYRLVPFPEGLKIYLGAADQGPVEVQ